jgi:hypothetical protein
MMRGDTQTQALIVRRPADLTVAWAQRIVDRHADGVVVSGTELISVDIGTTTRVRLAVEHNGPETLPRRWFVKLPSRSWRARLITALPRLLRTEVRFYTEAAQSAPVLHPALLAAESRRGRGSILVLADVTECGAVTLASGDALTAGEATLVVEQLAQFHAWFWDKDILDSQYRWLGGPVRKLETQLGIVLAEPLMRRGLKRAGNNIPRELHGPAIRYSRRRRRAMQALADGPRTLVHHDLHPGNLFWQQGQPGFLDWQLVRIGEGVGDIAYFLATALAPETRRAHEERLLERYRQVLMEHGITAYDPTALRQRYRAHIVYALEAMVVTLGIGGMMSLEANLELVRRAAAAVEDNDSFDAGPLRKIIHGV